MSTFFLFTMISIGILATLFSVVVISVFLLAFLIPSDYDVDE